MDNFWDVKLFWESRFFSAKRKRSCFPRVRSLEFWLRLFGVMSYPLQPEKMPTSSGALAFEWGKWYCSDSGKWARAHFFLLCRHPRGSILLGLELGTKDLGKQVQLIAEPIARALDLEVLEVICHGRGAGSAIRITLDKEGGVGIRDCEQFHQSLSRALAVADPIPFEYGLEVSSPGVDRPLKNPQDFRRVMGKLLKVKIQDPDAEPQQVIGRLTAVTEAGLTLTVQTGKQRKTHAHEVEVFWNSIIEGKQQVEF